MEEKNLDINALTNKEIAEIEAAIKRRRDAEKEEKKRLAEVKAKYTLNLPDIGNIEYGIMFPAVVRRLVGMMLDPESKGTLSKEDLVNAILINIQLNDLSYYRTSFNYSNIYPCPHCGKLGVLVSVERYLGQKKGHDRYKEHNIECRSCEWKAPKKIKNDYLPHLWQGFHEWLIKQGFVEEGTEFPGKTVGKSFFEHLRSDPDRMLRDFV